MASRVYDSVGATSREVVTCQCGFNRAQIWSASARRHVPIIAFRGTDNFVNVLQDAASVDTVDVTLDTTISTTREQQAQEMDTYMAHVCLLLGAVQTGIHVDFVGPPGTCKTLGATIIKDTLCGADSEFVNPQPRLPLPGDHRGHLLWHSETAELAIERQKEYDRDVGSWKKAFVLLDEASLTLGAGQNGKANCGTEFACPGRSHERECAKTMDMSTSIAVF